MRNNWNVGPLINKLNVDNFTVVHVEHVNNKIWDVSVVDTETRTNRTGEIVL